MTVEELMTAAALTRPVSILPQGTALSRYMMVKALGQDLWQQLSVADKLLDTPQVAESVRLSVKAAVPAGSTTDATWAAPLAAYGIAGEAIALMRGMSIIGALEGRMQRVPLHARVSRETGTGFSGGWIAPGGPTPVQKTDFAAAVQEHYKFGVIVPLSRELMQISNPDAEATVRRTVLGGLTASIDNQFLLPSVAAVANLNPASITNGATAVTSTGSTAAQITADLASMLAAIATPGAALVWIMRPLTMARIALALGAQAAGLPNTLLGIPVIASVNSPAQITLVDASQILYSDSGQFDVDVSENAALQLDTAPADPTVATTVMQSLWGNNLVAMKALRWLAWLRLQTGAVAYMAVTY